MMIRARATTCAAADSAGSSAIDRLARRRAPETFMTLPSPTPTSVLVAPDEAGERLDRVLARHLADLSRSRLKTLIEAGTVEVDGHTIRDPTIASIPALPSRLTYRRRGKRARRPSAFRLRSFTKMAT